MNNIEKIRVLLPHWITHNEEHTREFAHWLNILEEEGRKDLAEALSKCIDAANAITKGLQQILEMAGGPIESHTHGHIHHHGHHHD